MGFLLIVALFIAVYLAYSGYKIKKAYMLAKTVYGKNAEVGSKLMPGFNLLIDGDSIGTGVGASGFEKSAAGSIAFYLGKHYHVKLTNNSVNGSKISSLVERAVPLERQDLAVLFISSNDYVRFTDLKNFREDAARVMEKYSKISKKVIIIGPANVGLATMLPLPLRIFYLCRGHKYAAALQEASAKFGNAAYINSLKPPKRLGKYAKEYYASDRFHPNDKGHEYWFKMIKPYL